MDRSQTKLNNNNSRKPVTQQYNRVLYIHMNLCDLWCRERVKTSASLNIPQYIGSRII